MRIENIPSIKAEMLILKPVANLYRAQICLRLDEQGIEPPPVDYIYYVQEK